MGEVVRRVGLSLGADICWPICYQEIIKTLDLAIPYRGDTVRFEVERMTIEPFDLRQPAGYDVVIDRLTHWYRTRREWIKKAVLLDDVYVFNNPWTVQSMEKLTTYCAMIRLGFPIPRTWLVPPKSYDHADDLQVTLERYARYFDLGSIGRELGYPLFMKPYDGGAWRGVSKIDDEQALRAAYEESGTLVMNLQEAVEPFDRFVRCVGLGPQSRLILYDPTAPLHDRYTSRKEFATDEESALIRDMTLVINAFFGWDFNSCEVLRKDGNWSPIDFANPCPDSQVTSLHYHFPWLIAANIRWSLFAAATRRRMKPLTWEKFSAVMDPDATFRENLDRYVALAHQRFDTDRFEEFCARHLPHLDEVTHTFFGTEVARGAVRAKVAALFPEHEVDSFTELFWSRIQQWRQDQAEAPDSGARA